jgi:hypothetical protein
MFEKINGIKASAEKKVRLKVREKAIEKAKVRIALSTNARLEDFSGEELEVIVKEEEDKLYAEAKSKGGMALLVLLGMDVI